MGKGSTEDKGKTMAMGKLIIILVICLIPNLVQATKNTEKSNSEYCPFQNIIQNNSHNYLQSKSELSKRVIENIREETIQKAEEMMKEKPVTVTASFCKRSTGGKHDFYSEGDYWWPDTINPGGPYIRKD
jgi:competence protein ComGC